uniref:Uncharacterized protein n=1 Tax=Anguilla anguilla TaxID=7936 RepID=A0A0E9VVX1_ANGAN
MFPSLHLHTVSLFLNQLTGPIYM